MSETQYASEVLWSAAEVAAEIGQHRDDLDWVPHELKEGGYVVKDSRGRLLPPPTTKQQTKVT